MKLDRLLEISRYIKANMHIINEAYSNTKLEQWQKQIWNGYWYNDIISDNAYTNFSISCNSLDNALIRFYKNHIHLEQDLFNQNFITLFTTLDGYCNLFGLQKADIPAHTDKLTWPIAKIIRQIFTGNKNDDIDNIELYPFRNLKLTDITNDNLELIPFEDARKKQYKNYILFWVTESNKLYAISYNNTIYITFNSESSSSYYYNNRYVFNTEISQLPDVNFPEDVMNDRVLFAQYAKNILKPWYKIIDTSSITIGPKNIKEELGSNSTMVFYKNIEDNDEAIVNVYGIDIDNITKHGEAEQRADYKQWINAEKTKLQNKQIQFENIKRRIKKYKEYINLQMAVNTQLTDLYEYQEILLELLHSTYNRNDNDNENWLLKKTATYSGVINYKAISDIYDNFNKAANSLMEVLLLIKNISDNYKQNIKNPAQEFISIFSDIKNNIRDYNADIKSAFKYIHDIDNLLDIIKQIIPSLLQDANRLESKLLKDWLIEVF